MLCREKQFNLWPIIWSLLSNTLDLWTEWRLGVPTPYPVKKSTGNFFLILTQRYAFGFFLTDLREKDTHTFREREREKDWKIERERERERETSVWQIKTSISCLLSMPNQGSNPQPRHVWDNRTCDLFGAQDDAPTNWATWPGPCITFDSPKT